MEQLILHLIGDYVTQTSWMAENKTKRNLLGCMAALVHAIVYSLPFLLLKPSAAAMVFIFGTHFLIDHFGLARYLVFAKNWITEPTLKWADCNCTGYRNDKPAWLSVWLLIAADNCLHLTLNWLALR